MILQKGMEVLVNASMIGHPPVRPYLVTEIWDDTVFLEGLWDLTNNHPLHIPKIWLWPILNPGERVQVVPAPLSPLAKSHKISAIWTVQGTLFHNSLWAKYAGLYTKEELPCAIAMAEREVEARDNLFDPRFLESVDVFSTDGLSPVELRDSNTKLGATICAKCGGPLKIPIGLGPKYQHCPKCEP